VRLSKLVNDVRDVRRWVVVATGLLAAGFLTQALVWTDSTGRRRYVLFDDAMISLSYARTFANGDGLVWFSGAPRVQGITNVGWTLLMVPSAAIASSTTVAAVLVSLMGIAALIGAGLIAHRLSPLAGLVCVTYFPLVYWSVRGMEVGVLLLLLLTTVVLVSPDQWSRRRTVLLVVVVAVGVLVRFDFVLVGLTVAAVMNRDRRKSVTVAGATLVSAVLVVAAQWVYYGSWLPNTYTLKMSGGPLDERIAAGVASLAAHPQAVILAVLALWVAGRSDQRVRMLGALVLVINAYNVWVGGDSWEYFSNRYHALSFPVAVIAVLVALSDRWAEYRALVVAVVAWCAVAEWQLLFPDRAVPSTATQFVGALLVVAVVLVVIRTRSWALAVAMLVIFSSAGWVLDVGRGFVFDHEADRRRIEQANALRAATDDDAVIAVVAAGTIVFDADRSAVDLLGKSDDRIAHLSRRVAFFPGHDKWDLAVSVGERRPDIVVEMVGDAVEAATYLESIGYVRMCPVTQPTLSWYVNAESPHVNREALGSCQASS